jgi:16S rRNA C967 or C1407 C5-methylase (RsmB/RsmF family)
MTYSTCSLDPEENELCVMKFLSEVSDVNLLDAKLDGLVFRNKLEEFKGIKIPQYISEKTIRIWPHDNDTNGFFVAKFEKKSLK